MVFDIIFVLISHVESLRVLPDPSRLRTGRDSVVPQLIGVQKSKMKCPQRFSSLSKEICYFTSEGLIWEGRVEVAWDATGIILHRGSLKAR